LGRAKLGIEKKKQFIPIRASPALVTWVDDFVKRHPERFATRSEWIREAMVEKIYREKKRERLNPNSSARTDTAGSAEAEPDDRPQNQEPIP
jgi:Arc/MetJ-type ribon-helix-helix transcriptional regulator